MKEYDKLEMAPFFFLMQCILIHDEPTFFYLNVICVVCRRPTMSPGMAAIEQAGQMLKRCKPLDK